MRNSWRWILAGLAAGLLGAYLYSLANPEIYVSTAIIRELPAVVAEHYGAPSLVQSMADRLSGITQSALSRNSLANMINTYDLYPAELARLPLDDVIEQMTKQIKIDRGQSTSPDLSGISAFTINFRHPDRFKAQKVTRHLMTLLIDGNVRQRSGQAKMTAEFLKENLATAARDWEDTERQAAHAAPGTPGSAKQLLDRDLARQHYQSLHERMADAEIAASIETRGLGSTVEVLDLPSLPEHPENSLAYLLMIGAALGLIAALVAASVRQSMAQGNEPTADGA